MSTTTTTRTKTSGSEKPTKFVEHIQQYPTVKSGVSTFQSYPLGKKSVDTFSTYYSQYLSPFLSNFGGAYKIVAPYVLKADDIADSGLQKVDSQFPIVTKDPGTIKKTVLSYLPLGYFHQGKDYLSNTYASEYRKCGESTPRAAFATTFVVSADALTTISDFLTAKKTQGQDYASEKYSNGYKYVNGKKDEAITYVADTAEKTKELAYVKKEEAKKKVAK